MSEPTNLRSKAGPPVALRPGTPEDADACGHICLRAFTATATAHGYPSDFPAPDIGIGLMTMLLGHPGFYAVVAERDGTVVGSNFLDERSPIAGVGPTTVDPAAQASGIGRLLMQDVLERASARGVAGVRLLQAAYNTGSISLYARVGFQVRDVVACMQGPPIGAAIPGYEVRPASEADVAACDTVCFHVHGHDRGGRITGYATDTALFGHAAGETTDDLKAIIGAARSFGGSGILVPVRNASLFEWCLQNRLRVVFLMTLMSVGLYNEPAGAYLPSVLY